MAKFEMPPELEAAQTAEHDAWFAETWPLIGNLIAERGLDWVEMTSPDYGTRYVMSWRAWMERADRAYTMDKHYASVIKESQELVGRLRNQIDAMVIIAIESGDGS